MRSLRAIHLPVVFEMWVKGEPIGTIESRLGYDPRVPFAVTMDFGAPDRPLWCCDRQLLLDGTRVVSGLGDIRVQPMAGHPGHTQVELRSPTGYAQLTVTTAVLRRFLKRTFRIVPPGAEHAWLDLGRALREFIDGRPHSGRP